MMLEPDEELRKILRQWEAPSPGAALDQRVWNSRKQPRRWRWIPVAAGLVLAVGIAANWPQTKRTETPEYRPLPNGAITVLKTGDPK